MFIGMFPIIKYNMGISHRYYKLYSYISQIHYMFYMFHHMVNNKNWNLQNIIHRIIFSKYPIVMCSISAQFNYCNSNNHNSQIHYMLDKFHRILSINQKHYNIFKYNYQYKYLTILYSMVFSLIYHNSNSLHLQVLHNLSMFNHIIYNYNQLCCNMIQSIYFDMFPIIKYSI